MTIPVKIKPLKAKQIKPEAVPLFQRFNTDKVQKGVVNGDLTLADCRSCQHRKNKPPIRGVVSQNRKDAVVYKNQVSFHYGLTPPEMKESMAIFAMKCGGNCYGTREIKTCSVHTAVALLNYPTIRNIWLVGFVPGYQFFGEPWESYTDKVVETENPFSGTPLSIFSMPEVPRLPDYEKEYFSVLYRRSKHWLDYPNESEIIDEFLPE